MKKSDKICIIACIVIVGFFVGCFAHYIMGMYLGFKFPFNTFLFLPSMHFGDFYETLPKYPLAPYQGCYFPMAYILLAPLSIIKSKLVSYGVFVSIFLIFLILANIKYLSCDNLTKLQNFQNIFVLSLLAYPVLFLMDRGNFDMILFPILFFAVYFFQKEKYMTSSLLFALENAIKPFTILFLFLFLFKKKYKEFFVSLLASALMVILGFVILKGNVFDQISTFIVSLANFNKVYVYNSTYALTNTSSIFTALKLILCSENNLISIPNLVFYYKIFSYIASFAILVAIWFEKTFWKKIALLTLSLCATPLIIYDYKIIFFYIPLWLFLNSDEKSKFDIYYSILFGLLLIPKQYLIFQHVFKNGIEIATYGCIVNPILMVIFLCLIIGEIVEIRRNKKLDNSGN